MFYNVLHHVCGVCMNNPLCLAPVQMHASKNMQICLQQTIYIYIYINTYYINTFTARVNFASRQQHARSPHLAVSQKPHTPVSFSLSRLSMRRASFCSSSKYAQSASKTFCVSEASASASDLSSSVDRLGKVRLMVCL